MRATGDRMSDDSLSPAFADCGLGDLLWAFIRRNFFLTRSAREAGYIPTGLRTVVLRAVKSLLVLQSMR